MFIFIFLYTVCILSCCTKKCSNKIEWSCWFEYVTMWKMWRDFKQNLSLVNIFKCWKLGSLFTQWKLKFESKSNQKKETQNRRTCWSAASSLSCLLTDSLHTASQRPSSSSICSCSQWASAVLLLVRSLTERFRVLMQPARFPNSFWKACEIWIGNL